MDAKYTDKFAISQTAMKDWLSMSPTKWFNTWVTKTRKRPKKIATYFGSYLDCLMFTPKVIDKRFIIATVKQPSDKVTKILSDIFDHVEELNKRVEEMNAKPDAKTKIPLKKHTLDDKELVIKFCDDNEHYKGKGEQGYNDVLKKGKEYFEFLTSTKGKTVISPEDKADAEKLAEILRTDKISKGFFVPKDGCEVVYQQYIFTDIDVDYDNVNIMPLKGAIDIVHFNHKRKEVREVDLKATEDAFAFDGIKGPVRLFDYPGQHSFYDFLLRKWLLTYKKGIYKDYSVMNPLNVVIDRNECLPYIYEYNQHDLFIKKNGIEGTRIKGWMDTINEIAFHFDRNDWSRPMAHILNGKMQINVFAKR